MPVVDGISGKRILITGAQGELGSSLITELKKSSSAELIVGVDLHAPGSHSTPANSSGVIQAQGDILNRDFLKELFEKHHFSHVFHCAAILSTGGEKAPLKAHAVNVEGSLNLLALSQEASERRKSAGQPPLVFLFPSTIAAYGIANSETKYRAGAVKEDEFLSPITMYGINKLYVENLGRYFSKHFGLLAGDKAMVDFRALRFPGILSAHTVPTGGTSDYGPEMLHAAAKGAAYDCFVTPEARLPFMTMPDAVRAVLMLSEAKKESLTRHVYNVGAFSVSAQEIRSQVLASFPQAVLGYKTDAKRLAIVESWPADIDYSNARRDWGWAPLHDLEKAFSEYLIPHISKRYQQGAAHGSVSSHDSTSRMAGNGN